MPGPDRVLVARQADDARLDRLQRRLERPTTGCSRGRARRSRSWQRAGRADADRLDESASCQRHGCLLASAAGLTRRRCVGLQHVAEHRRRLLHLVHRARSRCGTWVFSNGGKSRPTITPCFAHASRKSFAGRSDVHEEEVALRVGRLAAQVFERLDGERAHLGVALALVVDVLLDR